MNLDAVMDEIGDSLATIPNLTVYPHPVDQIATTPTAIVQLPPAINYDRAFQRGMDRWDLGIAVAVSRVWDKAARDNISRFVDGDGTSSVHAALDNREWTTCAYARVTGCTFPPGFQVGGTDFVVAQFAVDVAGDGDTT